MGNPMTPRPRNATLLNLFSRTYPRPSAGLAPSSILAAASAAANSSGVLRLANGSGPSVAGNSTGAARKSPRSARGEARPQPSAASTAASAPTGQSANVGSGPAGETACAGAPAAISRATRSAGRNGASQGAVAT